MGLLPSYSFRDLGQVCIILHNVILLHPRHPTRHYLVLSPKSALEPKFLQSFYTKFKQAFMKRTFRNCLTRNNYLKKTKPEFYFTINCIFCQWHFGWNFRRGRKSHLHLSCWFWIRHEWSFYSTRSIASKKSVSFSEFESRRFIQFLLLFSPLDGENANPTDLKIDSTHSAASANDQNIEEEMVVE